MSSAEPTIAALAGLWRRSLIMWPDGRRDTTTWVNWLQGGKSYIDLRQPRGRPDFSGVRLSGLDLSGLDLSEVILRAAKLNHTKLTRLLEHYAEIGRSAGMAAFIRPAVRCLGTDQLTPLFETNTELERLSGVVDLRQRRSRLYRQHLECSRSITATRASPFSRNHACSIP